MLARLNHPAIFTLTCLLLRIVLDLSYVLFVSPFFAYTGYDLTIVPWHYVLSWAIYLALVLPLPRYLHSVSDLFINLGVLMLMAPMTALYGLADRSLMPLIVCGVSLWATYLVATQFRLTTVATPPFRKGEQTSLMLAGAMVLIVIGWLFASGAVQYFNLSIGAVYDFREASVSLVQVGIFSYLTNWVYKVFMIFLIAWSLLRKRFVLFLLLLMLQVFFFGVSSFKSVLFMPMLVVGMWYYFRHSRSLLIVPLFACSMVLLALGMLFGFGDILTPSILVRRMFFVVANLNFYYQDFFAVNSHIYWSNSVMGSVFQYPYNVNLGRLIGEAYGSGEYANSGYISSGYAHAGLIGVTAYSLIVGFILRQVEAMIKDKSQHWFIISMIIVPIFSLITASDVLVVLATHGLGVTIVLIALLNATLQQHGP